ncbi:Laminin Subunit Beta-2 [Manis pentadactyla]|nr:Laminin Subunit Beta-2 [Manis pentadactyla]
MQLVMSHPQLPKTMQLALEEREFERTPERPLARPSTELVCRNVLATATARPEGGWLREGQAPAVGSDSQSSKTGEQLPSGTPTPCQACRGGYTGHPGPWRKHLHRMGPTCDTCLVQPPVSVKGSKECSLVHPYLLVFPL